MAQDLVGFRDRGELRPCPVVVVNVGVIAPYLLAVRVFYLALRSVGRNAEKVVEVVSHGNGDTVSCSGLIDEIL
nr:hypothetical protein [Natrarchaeobaculum sulfurireducens]